MRWVCVVVIACGRGGFDPVAVAGDGAVTDGIIDAVTDGLTDGASDTNGSVNMTFAVVDDTFISNETGETSFNYGGAAELRSEADVSERILMRFNIATIPPSAVVVGTSVTVNVNEFISGTLTARPLLESWTEGNGDGNGGVANFTDRMTGVAWSTPGAAAPLSSGAVIGTAMPAGLGALIVPLDLATVQTWVSTPAQNFGLILLNSSGESIRLASSEDLMPSRRPTLSVTYVP